MRNVRLKGGVDVWTVLSEEPAPVGKYLRITLGNIVFKVHDAAITDTGERPFQYKDTRKLYALDEQERILAEKVSRLKLEAAQFSVQITNLKRQIAKLEMSRDALQSSLDRETSAGT